MHRRYRLTIRRKFLHLRHHLPTERGGDYPLQPALRWILLRRQCALRDDDVYLTVMPAFHIDCQCTAAMAAFSAGATFVLVEKYSARAFWGQVQKYRATITECIPMMIRTLMVQPPSANDRQHCLREVMFYLNLSEQERRVL